MDDTSVNQSGAAAGLDDTLGGLPRGFRAGNGDRVLEFPPHVDGIL